MDVDCKPLRTTFWLIATSLLIALTAFQPKAFAQG